MLDQKLKGMTKSASLLLCGLGYLAALLAAAAIIILFRSRPIIQAVALADLAATAVIFIFSFLSDNSSFYDPYWSVAPVPIALYLAYLQGGLSVRGTGRRVR